MTQISGQAARGGSQAPPASPAAAATDAATPAQSAPEVFALADRLVAEGRMQDAETLLEALTGDRALRYRSEARFRLGRLRVANGDLRGAIARYRALLDEEPGAVAVRLELARVYALANEEAAARRELRRASAIGLPDEVATAVDRFAGALRSRRRLGATIQVALAPDSNINRATSADEIGTVIGPLVPDRDARAKSGVGLALAGQAFWRGDDLLARLSARGDFYSRSRFNDMSVSAAFGPELRRGGARLRPAAVHARRWFGGSPYSQHYGASLNWLQPLTATSQVEVEASLLYGLYARQPAQDGLLFDLAASYERALGRDVSLRGSTRINRAQAEDPGHATSGADLGGLVARRIGAQTLFAEATAGILWADAPLTLFGRTRRDRRFDLTAGLLFNRWRIAGELAPLVRIRRIVNRSTVDVWDFRQTRVEFALSREF